MKEDTDWRDGGRPGFVPAALASRILGVSTERLKELANEGVLRRFGSKHGYYAVTDIEHLRGQAIDEQDIAFAEDRHQGRLASYARQNAKRRLDAYARQMPVTQFNSMASALGRTK